MFDWLKVFFPTAGKSAHPHENRVTRVSAIPAAPSATEAEACKNRGNDHFSRGDWESAAQCYRDAIALKPDYAEAHNNLGLVYQGQQKYAEAEHFLRQAISCNPRLSNAYFNLGTISKMQGRSEEALAHFAQALEIKPDYAEACKGMGDAYFQRSQYSAAKDAYRRAISIKPDYVEVWNNLGAVFSASCRLDEAIECYKSALSLVPDHPAALSNLIFSTNYSSVYSAEAVFREHLKLAGIYRAKTAPSGHANDPDPGRRLRVGYVSGDFRLHAVAYFFEPLLVYCDTTDFEVFCYSNTSIEDEVTARLKSLAGHWRNIFAMTDEQVVETIRHDQIDLLIDLSGNTFGNRLSVFACKPAPLQVTWLGYPNTTGLPAMDYRITDIYAEPEGMTEHLNTEKLYRLPEVFCGYRPKEGCPAPADAAPVFHNGHITFGCFNNFAKVSKPAVELWAKILKAVPGSKLLLESPGLGDGEFRQIVFGRFGECGVKPEQLELLERIPANQYRLYHRVDICLDPFPCNGGTTSCDALWMGTPLVTLAGQTFVSRMGVSLLSNVGLTELIAQTPEDYVAIATRLASDRDYLREIRHGLRERVAQSPLLDMPGFTRQMEAAYREMWRRWCDNPTSVATVAVAAEERKTCGNAHFSKGELDSAAACYRQAIALNPDYADAYNNLGLVFREQKRYAEAERNLKQAAALNPRLANAHYNLGLVTQEQDRPDEALTHYQAALEIKPDYAEAWRASGNLLYLAGRSEEAAAALQQVIDLKPDEADAYFLLGNLRLEQNQRDEAVKCLVMAVALNPGNADAHNNLGIALQALRRLDDAVASYARALALKPDYAEAHSNLGAALKDLGRLDDAVASYQRALKIKPDYADALNNLGAVLKALGQFDGAVASFRRALEINPDCAEAHSNLGAALQDHGQLDDAVASFRRALEIDPDCAEAYENLLFTLNYHPNQSGAAIFAAYREYDQRFGLPQREKWRPHGNRREIGRRLKVGYVSPDFRHHSCRHFLEPLLAHHDKNVVEVYAYAELAQEDAVTARYRGYVDHWTPTASMTDDALSERIRADGIDILVDLAGHNTKNRLSVFARKPAPVSLSWLGFGYTTGLTAIDYLLTDAAAAPAGSEGLFSETPWRLETPGYAYRPAEGMGQVSPLPALTRGHVTFGTLTRAVRINPLTIRVWSALLKRVEGARLVIDSHNFQSAATQDALAEKFAAHGIARERLEIGYRSPPWDVLRGLDIGLDCFPHNSGTTLFETLYMGVPFVTLAGRPSVGRLGSSILEGAGHPSLIARTEDEYVEIAAALASDLPKLAALRAGLRREMESGALMDEAGFARKVEAAYREMWRKWCFLPQSLPCLLARVTPENMPDETDTTWGKPEGAERW